MKIFIEYSIAEIQQKIKKEELTFTQLENECIELSQKYEKYKMWKSFSPIQLHDSYAEQKRANSVVKTIRGGESVYGIPFGVKDIINTIDYPTQMGSVIWEGFEAGNDARIIHNIKYNGGVIAGKTVTAEFAVHALNETLNPYDVSKTPGTSSSGSAVAVALGVVPVALATQTAASIMRPASFCGVYGFKPSFGLVPRTGVLKTTDSLDTIGFMTSHVKNIRDIFEIITVKGPDYPFVYEAQKNCDRRTHGDRKWKIAFIKTYTWEEAEAYVKDSIQDFVEKLQQDNNIIIEELNVDHIIGQAHNIHSIIYDKSLSYYFEKEHHDREHVSDIMNQLIEHGETIESGIFFDALSEQEIMCGKMDLLMQNYDAIISMSTSSVAPDRGDIEVDDPSLIWNLCHLASVNIPEFYENETGLPFGIQISVRRFNDYLLLELLDYLADNGFIPQHVREIKGV